MRLKTTGRVSRAYRNRTYAEVIITISAKQGSETDALDMVQDAYDMTKRYVETRLKEKVIKKSGKNYGFKP
jgi:hypothetical protein